MNPETFHVSFIIPTLNEEKTLPALLQSILALETNDEISAQEVIVIDSGSQDSTVKIAHQQGCKVVSVQAGNVSMSRNTGAENAEGNLLAFVDADCELPSDWLIEVAKKLDETDVLAAGACMTLNPSSTSWVEKTWYELAHKKHGDSPCDEVNWLATFNLAVRKKAFEKISGFDADLTTCEDVDFGYRLSKTGRLKKIYASGVLHHGESKQLSEFFKREGWRARGSYTVLKKNKSDLREVVSFLLPIAITLLTLCSIALALTLMLVESNFALTAGALLAIAICLVGAITLLATKKGVSRKNLPRSAFLLWVYMLARCYGSFRSFDRVER